MNRSVKLYVNKDNNMKHICFIAQFPPPIHGLSKAVNILFKSNLRNKYIFTKINITKNSVFPINVIKILFCKADIFYITLSQSKLGNLRDLLIVKLILHKNKKCIVHLHGGYYRELIDNDLPSWQRKLNYSLVSKIDAAIVLSDCFRNIFKDILPENKIYVIPNCVDEEVIRTDSKSFNPNGVKKILYLSNFIPSKGYREVLNLALLVKNNNLKYEFDFAGAFFSKKEADFFNTFIQENDLENIVKYHGIVSGGAKKKLLFESDIFILLTRYPKEGQPISIIEAMANGLIIVSTDHAAIPDMIEDNINGIIVNEKTSLDEIIYRLNELNFQKVSSANINLARKAYSYDSYINAMDNIFLSNSV